MKKSKGYLVRPKSVLAREVPCSFSIPMLAFAVFVCCYVFIGGLDEWMFYGSFTLTNGLQEDLTACVLGDMNLSGTMKQMVVVDPPARPYGCMRQKVRATHVLEAGASIEFETVPGDFYPAVLLVQKPGGSLLMTRFDTDGGLWINPSSQSEAVITTAVQFSVCPKVLEPAWKGEWVNMNSTMVSSYREPAGQ